MRCPYCGSPDDCPHVILAFGTRTKSRWQYTRIERGIDSYRSHHGLKLTSATLAALRQFCKIEPGVIYPTEWGVMLGAKWLTSSESTGSRWTGET